MALVGLVCADQEGTLSSVFSELESVGSDLEFGDRQPPAVQVKHVVTPSMLPPVDAVTPSNTALLRGPLEMSLDTGNPPTKPGVISMLTSDVTDYPFKPLLIEPRQRTLDFAPNAPKGVVGLLTSVADPLKGPLQVPKAAPEAPKGFVSLLMTAEKIPKPQTTGSADVLGAPLMDDVPPQDFDHQDPEAEVGTLMDETPGPSKPPADPKAESPLPPELAFLVPESERNPEPAVEAPSKPAIWSNHWKPGDPASGADPARAKPTPKPSISSVLKKMEERRLSLLRDARASTAPEIVPYVPPISDVEVRALFQPKRKNPNFLTWGEFAKSPSRLQAAHNIYFNEMRALARKAKEF